MTSAPEPRLNEGHPVTELNAEEALGLVSYGLMQRLAGEGWVDWSENQSDLVDNAIQPSADKTLTFDLIEQGLSFVFLPVMVTFAYTVEDGSLKSGYMVID